MDYRALFVRDNYSEETISNFDILGSYFVHTFYNVLYNRAKHRRASSKNRETLTYHYKILLKKYSDVMELSKGVTAPRKKLMKDVHEYYADKTRFKSYTYSDFLTKITSEFLPTELVDDITNQQKQKVFEECIINAITSFEQKIQQGYIKYIIDDHKNRENTKLLRDIFIDCLIFQRERLYNKIAKRSVEHYIPRHIADKLNVERNLALEKCRSMTSIREQEKEKHEQEKEKLVQNCEQMKMYYMKAYEHITHRNTLLEQLITKSDKMSADLVDKNTIITQSQIDLDQTQTNETDLQRNFEQLTLKSRVHDKIVAGLNENIKKLSNELTATSEKLTSTSKDLAELRKKYNILEARSLTHFRSSEPMSNATSQPSNINNDMLQLFSGSNISSPISTDSSTIDINKLEAMLSDTELATDSTDKIPTNIDPGFLFYEDTDADTDADTKTLI